VNAAAHRLIQSLALALVFVVALGALGPALDAQPSRPPARDIAGEIRRMSLQADRSCALAGENAGVIELADGVIACTDKRGRRLRPVSQVTVLTRAAP